MNTASTAAGPRRLTSRELRNDLFDRARRCTITLDGEPATIVGRLLDFPVVRTDSGKRAQVNWSQLERLVDRGGVINVTS